MTSSLNNLFQTYASFYVMAFGNQNLMVTRFTNLRNLSERRIYLFSLEKNHYTCYKHIGYNVMRQSACLVFHPIMVDNYASFFNCTPVGRASDSI